MQKLKLNIRNIKGEYIAIGILILILLLLKLPSLFEPHWNQTEGLYAAIAHSTRNGKLLYQDTFFTQPPGIIFIYLISIFANTFTLITVKLIGLIVTIGILLLIYQFTKKMFSLRTAQLATLIASILLGLPILEANIIHTELFFIFFILLGLNLIFTKKSYSFYLAGIAFGIALLFNIRAAFEIAFILLYLLVYIKNTQGLKTKSLSQVLIGLTTTLLISLMYLYKINVVSEFTSTVFIEKINSIGQYTSENSLGFIILPNTILLRSAITTCFVLFTLILYKRKKCSKEQLFLFLWGSASLYSVLFVEVYDASRLLQLVPVFSIISSSLFAKLYRMSDPNIKLQHLALYILTIFFTLNLFTSGGKFPQKIVWSQYYSNFYRYISGKIDTVSYTQKFSEEAYSLYKLNNLLQQSYKDSIQNQSVLFWMNNPWIYHLTRVQAPTKYLSSSEMASHFGEMEEFIRSDDPNLIIVNINSQGSMTLVEFLRNEDYELDREFENYRIYKLRS